MIGIFVNPKAGGGKALKIFKEIESILLQKKIEFIVFSENWPINLQNSTEAWIVGGDGTVNYFINKYKKISIPIALFKGGTGNDFAWKLYQNINIKQQVDLALNSSVKLVDVGNCNGRLFVNTVGIGFDGEILKSMNTIRKLGGHLGYLFIVIKKIFSFKEIEFKLFYNEREISEKYLLLSISNSSRTGGGFLISPAAEINDGKLNLILCKPLSVFRRLKCLPVIEKGKHLALPFIVHEKLEEIKVECNNKVYAQIDGDLFENTTFSIQVVNNYLAIKY